MVPYVKVKFQVIVFGYRAKIDKSELAIVTSKQFHVYIKAITRNSPEFSELSLWPDTQSFDMWGVPPRLEILPFTHKYQTQQKDFGSKMPDRCLYVYSAQTTSLRLILFDMGFFEPSVMGGGGGMRAPIITLLLLPR